MTAAPGQPTKAWELQLPGLFCRAAGLAWQLADGERRPVLGPGGHQVAGMELHLSLDGERLFNCAAVFLGADGQTGVVQRWYTDDGKNRRPRRYTQRGQVDLWLT